MQIQSVNKNLGFGAVGQEQIDRATEFVNMNNAQLKQYAYAASYDKKQEKKNKKSIAAIFTAIPFVDIASKAIQSGKNASLSTRAKTAGVCASGWALIAGSVGLYSVVKNAVSDASPGVKRFNRDNPILSFMVDLGAITGMYFLGIVGLGKLSLKAFDLPQEELAKAEQKANKIINKIDGFFNKVDETAFNKKILPKLSIHAENFAKKIPNITGAGSFCLRNSIWLMFGAAIIASIKQSIDRQSRFEHNYKDLKKMQLKTAKELVTVLNDKNQELVENADVTKVPEPEEAVKSADKTTANDESEIIIITKRGIIRTHHPDPDDEDDGLSKHS